MTFYDRLQLASALRGASKLRTNEKLVLLAIAEAELIVDFDQWLGGIAQFTRLKPRKAFAIAAKLAEKGLIRVDSRYLEITYQ